MNKMEMDLKEKIVKLLREELEYVEGSHKDDTYYSQWVMALAIKEVSKASYLARTVIKTSNSPYVDGTDITINIREDGEMEIDLSFAEDEPIFLGGEIADSIRWIEDVNNFCYMQPEDPFDSHVRNIINLYKALLVDVFLLGLEDITVEGGEVIPGQYKLEIKIQDKEFNLDANNKHTKADIFEEILNEIILPLVEAENPEDEKSY